MTEKINPYLLTLYESYENRPAIKGLIQILTVYGLPVGAIADTVLGTYVNKIKADRLRVFFEELNTGDAVLTEDSITNTDFLHAYFSTVNYVIRTRSDDKLKRFARILKNLYIDKVTIDEYEDYTSIFNDLSDREFSVLCLKYSFETKHSSNSNNLNPLQLTSSYWEQFKKEVCSLINIDETEFNPILVRIQRTGCYVTHKGYWNESAEDIGDTSELFKKLYRLVDN